MRARSAFVAAALAAVAAVLLASGSASGSAKRASADQPQRGGDLVIARIEDSQSMDKTTVFQNESIWVLNQMFEPLYTVSADGKSVKPWLATSYTLSKDRKTYTFQLRKGVHFSNGKLMTSADVKFSIDEARNAKGGWGYIDAAIKDIQAKGPNTVVIHTKYPWSPFLADIALFSNGIIPKGYAGMTKGQFYGKHPIGTGPFMWSKRVVGQTIKLVRNPHYWQKGKPYLDSVTWSYVSDDNTRELQLRGNQVQVDEFPPFNAIDKLKKTPGVTMTLFPSTRTDYLELNEQYKPLADVHVRRAISYAIDRKAMVNSILFGYGKVANSFLPPQVPYYDPESPGLQFDIAKAKKEMSLSKYPNGFKVELLVSSGAATDRATAQILQQQFKQLGITVTLRQEDSSTAFQHIQEGKYQLGFSYWTMDIADPDELVTFAVDPKGGANSFFTWYSNPKVAEWTHAAQREFNPAKRRALYASIQKQAAQDAFMGFMYYSPYRYAYSSKVNGFYVYPTGNYHMEDVWLSK
ncbi:MAG TPA: ABC transporter substrate-binding protein [Gaiellaceae bacterium]